MFGVTVLKRFIGILFLLFGCSAQAAQPLDTANFAFVDLLLWQVSEAGAEHWAESIAGPGLQIPIDLLDVPFNWDAGIRVGVGHNFQQAFDVMFTYTHYQTRAHDSAAGNIYSPYDANYFANNTNGAAFGPSYNNASMQWHLSYDVADVTLGRVFKPIDLFSFHPYVGIKNAYINQKINTRWFNPQQTTNFTQASENIKNDFWGIGPSFGIDTTWSIAKSDTQTLNLMGNASTALLYGHWHFADNYRNNAPTNISTLVSSVNGASPTVSLLLGVEWIKTFTQSDIHARLGYETTLWFNQLQFYALDMGRMNHLLALQGINLEINIHLT